MITQEQYNELRARYDRYQERIKVGFHTAITPDNPSAESLTNAEIGALEVFEFMTTPPMRYFAYVHIGKDALIPGYRSVTTFTGDRLGTIDYMRNARRLRAPNGGQYRLQTFTMIGINGIKYHGRFYPDSGDYCRITAFKHQ